MHQKYIDTTTRFLRDDERLILSEEKEMPLVIEAMDSTDVSYLQHFLSANSDQILKDIATYGAVLLRGFDVASDEDFEKTVLSIQGMKGISDVFMSEEGRIHVDNLNYVLHTNAVYKTGGTLYLGGFHSENYYTPDVPTYICFCCIKPSTTGGETGLINMEKVYQELDDEFKNALEKSNFFASKWLISEVAERYNLSLESIEKICQHFDLPIVGEGSEKFILMYKPSVFLHPHLNKKALQINLFEIPRLNPVLRKHFMNDYKGKAWFWHRLVWRLPKSAFKVLELIYITCASFCYSPKNAIKIVVSKFKTYQAIKNKKSLSLDTQIKVGSCFNEEKIEILAKLMRNYYSSCLWKKGDILLVDNRKVIHAGMPGTGPRLIRAMICNPLEMKYSDKQSGVIHCENRDTETLGYYMASGEFNPFSNQESCEIEVANEEYVE